MQVLSIEKLMRRPKNNEGHAMDRKNARDRERKAAETPEQKCVRLEKRSRPAKSHALGVTLTPQSTISRSHAWTHPEWRNLTPAAQHHPLLQIFKQSS